MIGGRPAAAAAPAAIAYRRVAERHARSTGAPVLYRHALPEELADQGGAFDAVLSLEVVEHVADRPAFLEALVRLVAPGGILVIGTLNRTMRSFVKAIIGAEYVLRWLPRGTHDWRKFVTPHELDLSLKRHGLMMVERCGVALNPISRQWKISKDDSVTYMQFHRKIWRRGASSASGNERRGAVHTDYQFPFQRFQA